MKKSRLIVVAGLAVAMSFTSCIENSPSAGVEAIRTGYAALLNAQAEAEKLTSEAEADLLKAQAELERAKIAAETAAGEKAQALADYEKINTEMHRLEFKRDSAQLVLDKALAEKENEEAIAKLELAIAQLDYDADVQYNAYKADSLDAVKKFEASMLAYETAKLDNEKALAQAERDAIDAAWELKNTLTAQQSKEAEALAAKWGEYATVVGELSKWKMTLADYTFDITRITEYKNKFSGHDEDNYFSFKDIEKEVKKAEDDLEDLLKEKEETDKYLAYLEGFVATEVDAGSYTEELINLEGQMDDISNTIGELKLEKEREEITFDVNRTKAAEVEIEKVDTKYAAVKAQEEAEEVAIDNYDLAVDNVDDYVSTVNGLTSQTAFSDASAEIYYNNAWISLDSYVNSYAAIDVNYSTLTGTRDQLDTEITSLATQISGLESQSNATPDNHSLLIQIAEKTAEKTEKTTAKTQVELVISTYYASWSNVEAGLASAQTAKELASSNFETGKDEFDQLCEDTFTKIYTYGTYDPDTEGTKIEDVDLDPFTFSKEVELAQKNAEYDITHKKYEALVKFLDGEYERNTDNDYTGVELPFVNSETIKYADEDKPYNTAELLAEIEKVKEELADDSDEGILAQIEEAQEEYDKILEESQDAKEGTYAAALLEICEIQKAKAQKNVGRFEAELEQVEKEIETLTAAVNAQTATQRNL